MNKGEFACSRCCKYAWNHPYFPRTNFNLMKDVGMITRVAPDRRVDSLMRFRRRLQETPEVQPLPWSMFSITNLSNIRFKKSLSAGDCNSQTHPCNFQLEPFRTWTSFKAATSTKPKRETGVEDFTASFNSYHVHLFTWTFNLLQKVQWLCLLIYPGGWFSYLSTCRTKFGASFSSWEKSVRNKISCCQNRQCKFFTSSWSLNHTHQLGRFSITMQADRTNNYLEMIDSELSLTDYNMVMCVMRSNRKDTYAAIKKKVYCQIGIPSQVTQRLF